MSGLSIPEDYFFPLAGEDKSLDLSSLLERAQDHLGKPTEEGATTRLPCLTGDGLADQLGQVKTVFHPVHYLAGNTVVNQRFLPLPSPRECQEHPQDSQEVFLLKHPLQETVREPPWQIQLRRPSLTPGVAKTQKAVEESQLPLPSTPLGPPNTGTEFSHSSPDALDVTRGSSGFRTRDISPPPTYSPRGD
ncbi:hypothetical protein Pmani_024570 [Petrolisthes manimaculis]|uniref:Uncharacterized protein n=1 Tax=Petrolisthes manimaculis TaxID=1843537 RepID=A0AAE1P8Z3_9EUCA|nr:hypothetical protein Pmani_024570 [Petrolisthes manimaculis]